MSVKEAQPKPSDEEESRDHGNHVNPNVKAAVDAFELADQVLNRDEAELETRGDGHEGKRSRIDYSPWYDEGLLTSSVNGYGGKIYRSEASLIGTEEPPDHLPPDLLDIEEGSGRHVARYRMGGNGDKQTLDFALPYNVVQVEGKGAVKKLTGKNAERAADIIHRRAAREVGDRAIQAAKARIDKLQQGIDKVEGSHETPSNS